MVIALIPIAILAALTDLTASFFIRLAVVQNFLTVFSIAFVQEFLIFPDSFIFELNQLYWTVQSFSPVHRSMADKNYFYCFLCWMMNIFCFQHYFLHLNTFPLMKIFRICFFLMSHYWILHL